MATVIATGDCRFWFINFIQCLVARYGAGDATVTQLLYRLYGDDCHGTDTACGYIGDLPVFLYWRGDATFGGGSGGRSAFLARRWLNIPGLGSVQPSEFLKLGMPMMCAWFLSKRELPPNIVTVLTTMMMILVPVLLIAKQPDLGTSLLVASSGLFVLFLAGLPWWMIGTAVALFVPFVLVVKGVFIA